MDSSRIIQKVIWGSRFYYDKWLDIIYQKTCCLNFPFDRTQVQFPVDLCIETTTSCNLACKNCFSDSTQLKQGIHASIQCVIDEIVSSQGRLIRVSITGGEPLIHPFIESLLRVPEKVKQCGFVINTNGTLRPELDHIIIDQNWLTAISLHGRKIAHNGYSHSNSFDTVTRRIESLAKWGIVHIYTVLHDALTVEDVEWLFKFRDQVGAKFLRFITPRNFGRFQPLRNKSLITEVVIRLDLRSGLKTRSSNTRFLTVNGGSRMAN